MLRDCALRMLDSITAVYVSRQCIVFAVESSYHIFMKKLTVKIPMPLGTWLSRRARELRRPQSELVRDALERVRSGTDVASCHDLMMDVCGSVNGPKDLSTNPKYLDDFGK